MKKFAVILLALSIAASFTGCGKNTDENTICYYNFYTVYSDDYNDYSDFDIRIDYDFNESRWK